MEPDSEYHEKCQVITVNLPRWQLRGLQVLQDHGIYPSRSEAIRAALDQFLSEKIEFTSRFEDKTVEPVPTTAASDEARERDVHPKPAPDMRSMKNKQFSWNPNQQNPASRE